MSESAMNVLCIPSWFPETYDPTNGIFIQKHIEAVSKHCNVVVLYVAPDPELGGNKTEIRKYEMNGIAVVESRYYEGDLGHGPIDSLKRFWRHRKAARAGLKETDQLMALPDLVHVHIAHPAARLALHVHKKRKIPFLISEQWTGYTAYNKAFYKHNMINRYLLRSAFRKARGVSTVSRFLSDGLEQKNLITRPARVIPNIVSLPDNPTFKTDKPGPIKAYTVSDLRDDAKNISGLMRSVKEVVKEIPDFQLHHIGIGPDKDALHQLAEELTLLDKNVFFHGYVPNEELFELFQEGHFFVLNSAYETFSVATAEAIGYGLPVVITKCGAPEEFVNEEVGLLVERDDVQSMAGGLKHMIKNWKEYNPGKLYEYAKERFSKEKVGKVMYSWYEEMKGD